MAAADGSDSDSKSGGDGIGFAGVDVSTPSGTRLIEGLTFDCQAGGGDNMLVVGENGVGKVSPASSDHPSLHLFVFGPG